MEALSEPTNENVSADDILKKKQQLLANMNAIKNEIKLFESGFVKIEAMGFIFPGVDTSKVGSFKSKKSNPKPPRLQVQPLMSNGTLIIDFDQEMIAPEKIDQSVYKSVLNFKLLSQRIDK